MQYKFISSIEENNTAFYSHLSEDYLKKYGNNNKIFVETGTYRGDTVKLALKTNLFEHIYSCEINKELFDNCVKTFKENGNNNVSILLGDSVDCLEKIIKLIDSPATFWLDAHASGHLTGGKSGGSPVVDELKVIASHHIKEHTIFIDDRRLFGSAEWSYVTEKEAMDILPSINPNYTVKYLDGEIPKDVICIYINKEKS